MPSTRRSSSGPRSNAAGGKQATLSFHNKVTKSVPKSTKDLISAPAKQSPLAKHVESAEAEEPSEEIVEPEIEAAEQLEEEKSVKSEAELQAEKITDRQVSNYWKAIEKERTAKRVHQGDLDLAEKILRYFDVSSQYGPCVGITRMKRWQRAERLGLSPPVEVLAVLLNEEKKGTKGIERAHMDDILNSTVAAM